MRLPSIKTLETITDKPVFVRKVLETTNQEQLEALRYNHAESFKVTISWLEKCYNSPKFHEQKMSMLNDLLETYGVEYTPKGKNEKSPAIEYCNAGDPYTPTLMFIRGNYVVGCWGDIVERGNYD